LSLHIKQNEAFARITGDKFYILLEYVEKDKLGRQLDEIIENILTFKFATKSPLNMVVCAGVYVIENTNITIDTISDRASLAANMIKGGYNSRYFFYNDDIHNQIIK